MNCLETFDVVKQYANHLALDKVSIGIPEGKIFGLLGPNGAGKTTLIRIINRITAPDSGHVSFKGRPMSDADIYSIGYLPEERGLYKKMKVGEQAVYLARLKGLSATDANKELKKWFKKLEIDSWWNKKLEELSKGMQQKIQFITTVVHQPELLIFDEPFSGFDPVNADLLKREILELKQAGKTIIFSTHNMASVEEICDEIALINQSKVVLQGKVEEIKASYRSGVYVLKTTSTLAANPFATTETAPPFTVLDQTPQADLNTLRIQKSAGLSNNELLSLLARQYEIVSFEEELPSMNDIFINTVS